MFKYPSSVCMRASLCTHRSQSEMFLSISAKCTVFREKRIFLTVLKIFSLKCGKKRSIAYTSKSNMFGPYFLFKSAIKVLQKCSIQLFSILPLTTCYLYSNVSRCILLDSFMFHLASSTVTINRPMNRVRA